MILFMRIGLMRHFPVAEGLPTGWMTSDQLQEWRVRYEASDVHPRAVDVGPLPWPKCYSSDLKRAYTTARAAHAGEIIQSPLLREVDFLPMPTGRLSLPVWAWHWVLRAAWLTAHSSQRSARDEFRNRVLAVANLLEAEPEDTLVVSHAGMMAYLRKELVRRGFRGPEFRIADHARLYVFERA